MRVPHYTGPQLDQRDWLKACPLGKDCVPASWGPPLNVLKSPNYEPDYTQSEWHCPQGYWYAPWIGISDTQIKESRIPIVCVRR
jgi:hypothetical protein